MTGCDHFSGFMHSNGTQYLPMGLNLFDWLFPQDIIDVKLSFNWACEEMSIFGIKDHINPKISNFMSLVLLNLGPTCFFNQTNYQINSYYSLSFVAETT